MYNRDALPWTDGRPPRVDACWLWQNDRPPCQDWLMGERMHATMRGRPCRVRSFLATYGGLPPAFHITTVISSHVLVGYSMECLGYSEPHMDIFNDTA